MADVTLSSIKGRTKKQQVFTASGTFVPSAKLLALGGWVEVLLVGGGGGGTGDANLSTRSGGSGGQVIKRVLQVAGAVTVTIGAGGAPNMTNGGVSSKGSDSTFGSLLTAVGGNGVSGAGNRLGTSAGEGSGTGAAGGTNLGQVGAYGFSHGGNGGNSGIEGNMTSTPGSGGSGSTSTTSPYTGQAGIAGICIVTWEE